jgi:serum/glucocorticoid-regulated kinase 2
MYRKILSDDPLFPRQVSEPFVELVTGLLHKNPAERFGPSQIRASQFYAHIDWAALERKSIDSPILPQVSDPESTEMFDKEFTDQMAVEPPTEQ